MTLHWHVPLNNLDVLLQGLQMTVLIAVLSLLFGFVVGTFVALMRISKNKLLSTTALWFVEFFRNTPFLVQLFFFYYGLPELGIYTEPIATGIIALGINQGAFNAEVIRAGLESVNKGILDAADALAMTRAKAFRLVIVPIALRVAFKPLGSNFINLVLTTSVLVSITVNELMNAAMTLAATTFRPFEVYVSLLVLYCLATFALSAILHLVDGMFISKTIRISQLKEFVAKRFGTVVENG